MISIDLNCDMGEGMLNDAALMPYITSANIACGFHAGDIDIMKRTVELALKHNVAIGAHPGFNDKVNFGRKEQHLSAKEYYQLIIGQLNILQEITKEFNTKLHHVKPHGALYNMAAKDKTLAAIISKAVKDFDESLIVYGLSGSPSITEAQGLQLETASEVFADRTYQDDGGLTPRAFKNAMIESEEASIKQVLMMVQEQRVVSINNTAVPIVAETICIHGDGVHAVDFAKRIHQTLKEKNIVIKAC
jgi:UPF0271 protein